MAYSALAPFYDQVMKHVQYHDWLDLIESIVRRFSLPKSASLLEIGGGTGSLGILLTKAGFYYTGSDLNFSMSRQAKNKGLSFFCSDGKYLPVKKKFDLIIFLYDGINYLQNLNEYKQLFLSVGSLLSLRGLFLFDITTMHNSQLYFSDFTDYMEIDGTSLVRHSYFNKKALMQYNDFTFFSPSDSYINSYSKITEHHAQKLFPPARIVSAVPDTIFDCIGIWDGFSMNHYTDNSERVHFLLQKKI